MTDDRLLVYEPNHTVIYRDLGVRSGFAISGLVFAAVAFAAAGVSGSMLALGRNDFLDLYEISWGFVVLSYLFAIPSWLVWSYTAHANLRALGRRGIRHSDQATIWWWIVPFANFVMPYRVMFETTRGSTAPPGDPEWQGFRLLASTRWWTGLMILGTLSQLSASILIETEVFFFEWSLAEERAIQIEAAGAFVLSAAAIVGAIMVRRVTLAQRGVAAVLRSQVRPGGMPAPLGVTPAPFGAPAQPTFPAEGMQQGFCSQCGAGFRPEDRFCSVCGNRRQS